MNTHNESMDISAFCREHEAFYEVRAYDVVVQRREPSGAAASRKIHAGFDVDVYGTVVGGTWNPEPVEYWFICMSIQKLLRSVNTAGSCRIEVLPFPSSTVLDTRRQMQRLGILRIRITHGRGLEQAAGPSEQHALKEVEARLREIAVRSPGGRAS